MEEVTVQRGMACIAHGPKRSGLCDRPACADHHHGLHGGQMIALLEPQEARHLAFARQYLCNAVPNLSRWQRAMISIQAPLRVGLWIACLSIGDVGGV
jgi:hypothetical protein